MKLGILKTDTVRPQWVEHYGEYPDMFVALLSAIDKTLEFKVYDVECQQYPQDVHEVDAYLITGSKSSAYDDEPWITELMHFVRELYAQKKKLLGICFGHQLVARALGGKVEKSSKGWGVGLQRYRFTSKPAWHDQADLSFSLLASHQDQVTQLAPEAKILAGNAFCEHAVCQSGDAVLTFQGHPEFDPQYLRELMALRRQRIGESAYQAGLASMAGAHEGQRVGRWMLNFLRS